MKFKIVYEGPINEMFDQKITELLEQSGAIWYAQGSNMETNERDICFDIDEAQ